MGLVDVVWLEWGSGSLKILTGVLVHRVTRPLRGSVSCGSGWSVPCVSIQLTLSQLTGEKVVPVDFLWPMRMWLLLWPIGLLLLLLLPGVPSLSRRQGPARSQRQKALTIDQQVAQLTVMHETGVLNDEQFAACVKALRPGQPMDPKTVPSRKQPPRSRAPSQVLGARSTSRADEAPTLIENGPATYATYWEELLRREYREAADGLRQRRSKWPRARLESSGLCLFDACATPDEELYGEKVVRVSKPGETRMADRFNRGDILVLSPDRRSLFGESAEFVPRECCVVDTGKDWVTVGVGLRWQTSGGIAS